jgi:hypothetical protein
MFRSVLDTEPTHDVMEHPVDPTMGLIPISQLALDLDPPAVGWDAFLASRGIDVVDDDIGRKSISRADARQLLDEHREAEAHAREVMERREAQLIQQDRLLRASLPAGLPAAMVPEGLTPAQGMMLAGEKRRPRSVREQLLEREFNHSNPPPGYQSIGPDEG